MPIEKLSELQKQLLLALAAYQLEDHQRPGASIDVLAKMIAPQDLVEKKHRYGTWPSATPSTRASYHRSLKTLAEKGFIRKRKDRDYEIADKGLGSLDFLLEHVAALRAKVAPFNAILTHTPTLTAQLSSKSTLPPALEDAEDSETEPEGGEE